VAGVFLNDVAPNRVEERNVTASGVGSATSLFARAHASIDVLYRELLKFGAVGAVAFVVDIGVFNLLRTGIVGGEHGLAEKPLTAKTISVLIATIVAWLGNRYWTFRRRRRASRRREFALFLTMNMGGLGISLACLGFSHYVLGLTSALADNIAGNVIGLGLGTLFRFWAYRQLVFTAGVDLDAPEAPTEHTAAEDALAAGAGAVEAIVVDLRTHSRPLTGDLPVPVRSNGAAPAGRSAQRSQA
jgi:putative flippase GtrA